jgi:D-alanyl-lipoteichoic acid acyltransferase DltB (MBOAT superfamily)
MLFNSYEFIFVFLPATLILFFAIGSVSREWALRWLIVASLCFYAWWRPLNALILAPSILINFVLARLLQRLRGDENRRSSKVVLIAGIVFNVAFLGYFKYANFAVSAVNDVFGTGFVLTQIILPLGVSFITFQKIAFLVDVHAGRVESFSLREYCLFVLFFPQLIAGPIVHYREMMPQFQTATCVFDATNVAVGLTLFSFGLFKKTFLADRIAPTVSAFYGTAASGAAVPIGPAWISAVGFTLQIYFDFSGYTDMALGIARLFGIRLPPNFNSPLRATSIIDFWLRWHMTLTRFLTAYVYNPLALTLTRRRMAQGLPVVGGRQTTPGAFVELLLLPTVLTMFISGLWHGAGYLFILWGLLHGFYLVVNHAWRLAGPNSWGDRASYNRAMTPIGFVLTFTCVVASMVVFRAPTFRAAVAILRGMAGFSGFRLTGSAYAAMYPETVWLAGWLVMLLWITLVLPNTLRLLDRYEPALGWMAARPDGERWQPVRYWSPSLLWALTISLVAAVGVLYLGGQSEFLYWQF